MASDPSGPTVAGPAGLTIRAIEPGDWREMYALSQLPRVRWGTLRMPFAHPEQTRKWLESQQDGHVAIVAVLDQRIVGTAGVNQFKGRRSHVGHIGMMVHDDFHGRGIGTVLLGALIDAADNWLNLKRLVLDVYVDNEPAIRLYKKFGFEIEGTQRAGTFRDGQFVDSYAMARLRGL